MAATGYGGLLDALRGVTWPARRAAVAGTAGTHRSRLRGLSAEFTEYRPYRQGDDPRRLDWKLLARTDRAYMRITSDRATLPTLVLVDASASMGFPPGSLTKWRQACRLTMGLAAVARASGDPIGLAVAGPARTLRFEPRTRRGVLGEIARALDAASPGGTPSLATAITGLRGTPRLAIVSDFLGDADDALRAAKELIAAGAEVHAIHVVAREELAPSGSAFLATDPEDERIARPLVAETRAAYTAAFAAWRHATARAWRGGLAAFTEVVDDEPAARAVRRITALASSAESSA
jgi:uncharacterized protein (DUF58 family)